MMKSMTAFGRGKAEYPDKTVTVEMKSVNSRFFDCTVKAPRSYAFLEENIKNHIRSNAVSRAKVDVYITVESKGGESGAVALDKAYTDAYVAALRTLRDTYGLPDDITTMTVAKNPQVFAVAKTEEDVDVLFAQLTPALEEAERGYLAMREAEGERIMKDLCGKVSLVSSFVDEIEKRSKDDVSGYREKLEGRLRAILADGEVKADENRLLTEVAIFADKIAIDEELVRLRSHFRAFADIAGGKEPAGRKLDFLMQEMNRETNTIGSKANNAQIARLVVNVKGELEKMREQIQNIE